jgi:hypothetical protein
MSRSTGEGCLRTTHPPNRPSDARPALGRWALAAGPWPPGPWPPALAAGTQASWQTPDHLREGACHSLACSQTSLGILARARRSSTGWRAGATAPSRLVRGWRGPRSCRRPSRRRGSTDGIAYRVPAGELGAGRLVIHRIVGGDGAAGFVVQGDDNPAPDPWLPKTAYVAGSAWLWLPGIGRAIAFVHQPAAAGALVVAVLVVISLHRSAGSTGGPPAAPKRRKMRSWPRIPGIGSSSSGVGSAASTPRAGWGETPAST